MTLDDVDFVLLASGLSSRYEDGDKLLAKLSGKPILEYSASLVPSDSKSAKLAILGPDQPERRHIADAHHWTIITNPSPKQGQGSSLAVACQALSASQNLRPFIVLLADMPFIPNHHLEALILAFKDGVDAVFTEVEGKLMPPALFSHQLIHTFTSLTGDKGAKSALGNGLNLKKVQLDAAFAFDIDSVADLEHAERIVSETKSAP